MIRIRYNHKVYLCKRIPNKLGDTGDWFVKFVDDSGRIVWVRVVRYDELTVLNKLANVPPLQQEVELCEMCGDVQNECECQKP